MTDLVIILCVIVFLLLFLAFGRAPGSVTSQSQKRDGVDDDEKWRE